MPLLVRRISRPKWDKLNEGDVSADAITNCLKTFQNDLSVWRISTEGEIDDALLALISGSKQSKLSTLHYVIIDEDIALDKGLTLKDTPGDTVAQYLIQSHRDIENLTYLKLGTVKELILECIDDDKASFRTRRALKELLKNAIVDGRIDKNLLNPELIENEKL